MVRFYDSPRDVWNLINADVPLDLNVSISPIFGRHSSGANVAMCDGSVRFLSSELGEKTICAAHTRRR